MKNFILLICSLFLLNSLILSQDLSNTYLVNENFNGWTSLPSGWSNAVFPGSYVTITDSIRFYGSGAGNRGAEILMPSNSAVSVIFAEFDVLIASATVTNKNAFGMFLSGSQSGAIGTSGAFSNLICGIYMTGSSKKFHVWNKDIRGPVPVNKPDTIIPVFNPTSFARGSKTLFWCDSINTSTKTNVDYLSNTWYHFNFKMDFGLRKMDLIITQKSNPLNTDTLKNLDIITNTIDFGRIGFMNSRLNSYYPGVNQLATDLISIGNGSNTNLSSYIDNLNVYYKSNLDGINVSKSLITGMSYFNNNGPSKTQSFIVTGTGLIDDIIITPSSHLEISGNQDSGFVNTPLTLTRNAGNVASTTIYVRLKEGLSIGTYTDSIQVTSLGFESRLIQSQSVVLGPQISVSASSITGLTYNKNQGPSAEKIFTIGGTGLEKEVIVTPSSNIQISKTSGSGFANTALTFTATSGSLSSTALYARLKAGLNPGTYADSIVVSSENAISKIIKSAGTVNGTSLNLQYTQLSGLVYGYGSGPSSSAYFMLSATLLEDSIKIQSSGNYEMSFDNGYYSTYLTIPPDSQLIGSKYIYVRLKAGLSPGTYIDSIAVSTNGVSTKYISCSGSVFVSQINVSSESIKSFNYTYDNGPSDQQSFVVAGINLVNNVIITPDNFFQISTKSGDLFTNSPVNLSIVSGTLNSKTIYVRLKAGLTAGNYNGKIIISSVGAESVTIYCTGTIDAGSGLIYTVTVPSGTNACFIGGTMNNWIPQAMNKLSSTQYSITISNANITDTYKYYFSSDLKDVEKNSFDQDITPRTYSSIDSVAAWTQNLTSNQYQLIIQHDNNGRISLKNQYFNAGDSITVESDSIYTFLLTPNPGYEVASLTYEGKDMTSQIQQNQFTLTLINSNATLAVTFRKVLYIFSIKINDFGKLDFTGEYGTKFPPVTITPESNWEIFSVIYNDSNYTNQLIKNMIDIPVLTANVTLSVVFVQNNLTSAPENYQPALKVYPQNHHIVIEGVEEGESVKLFNLNGLLIRELISSGNKMVIPVLKDQVYLVRSTGKTFKVLM